jgi:hypothetical protein
MLAFRASLLLLLLLGQVQVRDAALERLGGHADRFREGRMRMDGQADAWILS